MAFLQLHTPPSTNSWIFYPILVVSGLWLSFAALADDSPALDSGTTITRGGIAYKQYHFLSDGNLAGEFPILNNVGHGVYYKWFHNGNLRYIATMLNGNATGILIVFNPDGKLIAESSYYKNKLDGISATFYDSGLPKTVEFYKNGNLVGKPTHYDEKGDETSN